MIVTDFSQGGIKNVILSLTERLNASIFLCLVFVKVASLACCWLFFQYTRSFILFNFQTDYLTIYLSFNQHIKLLLSSLIILLNYCLFIYIINVNVNIFNVMHYKTENNDDTWEPYQNSKHHLPYFLVTFLVTVV